MAGTHSIVTGGSNNDVLNHAHAARYTHQALGVVARLGVADVLAAGPADCDSLALALNCHAPSLYRLLRMLAGMGVFVEDDAHRFANTPFSEGLRRGGVTHAHQALFAHPAVLAALQRLEQAVCTGQSAFELAHGEPFFAYLRRDEALASIFDDAMSALSVQVASQWVELLDPSDMQGVRTLVDVGGGSGIMLTTLLNRFPHLCGILFDFADVIARARQRLQATGLITRCEVVAGDFFANVPRGDGYLLKSILHDWDDARATRILQHIAAAASPDARLWIIEMVVPEGNTMHPAKAIDMSMMLLTSGGRERTLTQWRALLTNAGFRLDAVTTLPSQSCVLSARSLG